MIEISVGLLALLVTFSIIGVCCVLCAVVVFGNPFGAVPPPYTPQFTYKPRVRVKAGSERTNPLDGARLWGGS